MQSVIYLKDNGRNVWNVFSCFVPVTVSTIPYENLIGLDHYYPLISICCYSHKNGKNVRR